MLACTRLSVVLGALVPLAVSGVSWMSGCALLREENANLAAYEPASPAEAGAHVVLAWTAPVDLDLYVTDPTLETVYYGNTPSSTGGELEKDLRCDELSPTETVHVERISWNAPPKGTYRVGVDYPHHCDTELEAVRFRVIAGSDGQRWTKERDVRFHGFDPAVLEFRVEERRTP